MKNKSLVRAVRLVPGSNFIWEMVRLIYFLLRNRSLRTILYAPPGHFYSPLPELSEVRKRSQTAPCAVPNDLLGVQLRQEEQLEMLEQFAKYYDQLPFAVNPKKGMRYYYANNFFGVGDSVVLYCMIRIFRPTRIIEIGSGFSSAAMLDTASALENRKVEFTFIEPDAERLLGLLTEEDKERCTILQSGVQGVSAGVFGRLAENDILFVDSSHTSKTGSDVNYLLFEVLPRLKPGVIVHFHDIIWPFEYPTEWLLQGISWNEAYLLRAFLSYNECFEIVYFNSFVGACHHAKLKACLPNCAEDIGGSIWLRKKTFRGDGEI